MGKTILLADDSVTIQKVVELTFMDEDYEVVAVSNGDEALHKLSEMTPDLLIADVHMPGANGYEVCRQAKQAHAELPVLLLVGTFEPFEESEAEDVGADGHLKKPFDSQELLRRVEELLSAAPVASEAAPEAAEVAEEPMGEEPDLDLPDLDGEDEWAAAEEGSSLAESESDMGGTSGDTGEEMFALADESEGVSEDALDLEVPSDIEMAEEGEGAPVEEAQDASPEGAPAVEAMEIERSPWTVAEEEASAERSSEEEQEQVAPSNGEAVATGGLSADDVDRIARRVVELMGDRLLREVAWEVVPDLAEVVIRDRLRELERQLE